MSSMKAITIVKRGIVAIREIPMPVPGKDEALLKPLYGGICGSDLKSYRGTNAYLTYPRIPGHEFSAQIAQINGKTHGFKEGDVVVCNPYFNCGTCYSCRRGLVNACICNQTMGVQREGAFAEYIVMPVNRIIDGKGLSAQTLALIEPFCIGRHGIQRAGIKKGDRVLIMGAGTIGVLSAIAAKACGAQVYISDVIPKKLRYAMRFGIDGTILNSSKADFDHAVREITDKNGFDVTVEAVGLPSTFQDCLDAVAFGGNVLLIGISNDSISLEFSIIQKKELNIFGSRNALTTDFEMLIDTVIAKKLELDDIITRIYPFEEAARAFAELDKNNSSMLKVMIKF
jgi:2-desacetyl-2-hydroxyethyl bacteriochlorophyllide A dehydrogenase